MKHIISEDGDAVDENYVEKLKTQRADADSSEVEPVKSKAKVETPIWTQWVD